jgi:NAD/NADP transhydrogenase beta subunit
MNGLLAEAKVPYGIVLEMMQAFCRFLNPSPNRQA